MMPELKALFDSPRLWPGKGARMQGYGDKQTISGVTSPGANGVYTLGRSEKSGLTPQLSTAEQPVELRAGPGVRLHGYGGIHTLERLPVEEEVVKGFRFAGLRIEVETQKLFASICGSYDIYENPPIYVISTTSTEDFENGTITTNTQYSGPINFYEEGESPPLNCVYTVTSDVEPPPFDYGPSLGTGTYSVTSSRSVVSLRQDAISNLRRKATAVSSEAVSTWGQEQWQSVNENDFNPAVYLLSQGSYTDPFGGEAWAKACRWRVVNFGQAQISLNWEKRRDRDNRLLMSGAINVAPGMTTDWSAWPSLSTDPDELFSVRFVRIYIGP
jgi:hypothetical protein